MGYDPWPVDFSGAWSRQECIHPSEAQAVKDLHLRSRRKDEGCLEEQRSPEHQSHQGDAPVVPSGKLT